MDTYSQRSATRTAAVSIAALLALLLVTTGVLADRLSIRGHFSSATGASSRASSSPHSTPSPTAPAPSGSASAPATSTAGEVTITGVGDVVMGSAPDKLPPNNARGFFDSVASSLHGEVVTGNLDAALSDNTSYQKCAPPSGKGQQCFVYREPPSYAKLLKTAGFTVINVANNHSLDAGYPGLADTKQALRNAGLDYTGAPNQITLQRVSAHDKQGKPITVAVLGFSSYSWGAKVTDIPVAQQLVRSASQQADVVVVNMQAGAEGPDKNHVKPGVETYLGENRGDEIAFSHAVVDAGADLVIGHGPQVLRGMQWYHGRLIAYSLGKLASYRTGDNDGASASGAILTVTLHADGSWGSGKLTATQLTPTGLPALDPQGRAHTVVGRLSTVDFASQAVRVDDAGGIAPPAP